MVVVGGLRSIYGTVAGAFVIFAVPELVLKQLPVIGDVAGLPYIFSGVLIIVVIMFFPQGMKGLADLVRGLVVRRASTSARPVPDEVAAR
jgi:branched-chain amino acid transport system permease protein